MTSTPPPWATKWFTACFMSRVGEATLTRHCVCQAWSQASSPSSIPPAFRKMAAFSTTQSMRGAIARAWSQRRSMAGGSPWSAARTWLRPGGTSARAARAPATSVLQWAITVAPSAPNLRAIAAPIPFEAPVTRTVLPASCTPVLPSSPRGMASSCGPSSPARSWLRLGWARQGLRGFSRAASLLAPDVAARIRRDRLGWQFRP